MNGSKGLLILSAIALLLLGLFLVIKVDSTYLCNFHTNTSATPEEIKNLYHKIVKKYHPEKSSNDEMDAEERRKADEILLELKKNINECERIRIEKAEAEKRQLKAKRAEIEKERSLGFKSRLLIFFQNDLMNLLQAEFMPCSIGENGLVHVFTFEKQNFPQNVEDKDVNRCYKLTHAGELYGFCPNLQSDNYFHFYMM